MAKLRLKELREEKGLSQAQLGKEVDLNWRTISNYELGVREPNIEIIEKLCKYFEVTAGYFLGLED